MSYQPDISYVMGVVSRYMHEPGSGLDIVHRILRYLKGTPGKRLWLAKSGHLEVDGCSDSNWAVVKTIEDHLLATVCLWRIFDVMEKQETDICVYINSRSRV